ncbi:hypothetical protein HDU93_003280 [Gonapodya sp. JEL0774]|nr:hypothetical protein HDU93_003280 [Gonapodya sp. JEL0774]
MAGGFGIIWVVLCFCEADHFFDGSNVSFVGRPFPLAEADMHFERLKRWGFNFLRFLLTWEALEHKGPGSIDHDYIDYVVEVLRKAKIHGFRCFIDPHQDVWSRFTGGSGAPLWVLTAAGLDPTQFAPTEAAIVHNVWNGGGRSDFPKMIWPTNYSKLACASMFTLFFGGSVYAPLLHMPSPTSHSTFRPSPLFPTGNVSRNLDTPLLVSIEAGLQHHFMSSFFHLYAAIVSANLTPSCVVGVDPFNEPHHGFIGLTSTTILDPRADVRNGSTPTALQAMALGAGLPADVEQWKLGPLGFLKTGVKRIDPAGATCWNPETRPGGLSGGCIWRAHGVWEPTDGKGYRALRPDYFALDPRTGKPARFVEDFWKPFVRAFGHGIRQLDSYAAIFLEPPVNTQPPMWGTDEFAPSTAEAADSSEVGEGDVVAPVSWWRSVEGGLQVPGSGNDRMTFCPHYYDDVTLGFKEWNPRFSVDYLNYVRGNYSFLGAVRLGVAAKRRMFREVMDTLRDEGQNFLGCHPTVIGEIGVPFDLFEGKSYSTPYPHNYRDQTEALDYNLAALEHALVDFTWWCYTPDNTHKWGDGWNGEDLSVLCADERSEGRRRIAAHSGREDSAAPEGDSTTSVIAVRRAMRSKITEVSQSAATIREAASLSIDDLDELDLGGRALDSLIRPYPIATPGDLETVSFVPKTRLFRFVYTHPGVLESGDAADQVAEIFMPRWHYPDKREVNVRISAGTFEWVETKDDGDPEGILPWDEMVPAWKGVGGGPRFRCSAGGVRRIIWRCGCWDKNIEERSKCHVARVKHEMVISVVTEDEGSGGLCRIC